MRDLKKRLSLYKEYNRTISKIETEIKTCNDKLKSAELKQKRDDMLIQAELYKYKINNIINKNIIKYEHNKIMHEYYIDNLSVENIAVKEKYSERYIWKIIKKSLEIIYNNTVNNVDSFDENIL